MQSLPEPREQRFEELKEAALSKRLLSQTAFELEQSKLGKEIYNAAKDIENDNDLVQALQEYRRAHAILIKVSDPIADLAKDGIERIEEKAKA